MKRRISGKRHESNTKKVALIFIIGTCIGIVCLWGLVIRKGQKEIQPTVASVNSEVPTEQEIPESTKEIEIKTYDPRDHRIHLVMVGDMLMHTRVLDSGKKEDGSYNYDHLFSHVKEEIADADLAKAHELADFVIVCPHWGTEYRLQSDAQQKKWTQIFLENGVDLVIGTHPHVIEPIEYVSDEAGHQMLVYYSLGNFVNGTESTEGVLSDRMLGGIAEVVIGRGDDNRVQILDYDVDALVCHIGKKEAYSVYYLSEYNEELAKENLIRKQYPPFSYEYVDQLARKVWGDELVDKKMWKKPAA